MSIQSKLNILLIIYIDITFGGSMKSTSFEKGVAKACRAKGEDGSKISVKSLVDPDLKIGGARGICTVHSSHQKF